jgi:hypothetical protein
MNIKAGTFIEFGAWDGKYLSNTYNLFNNGWSGIYIEADTNKYKDLLSNFGKFSNRIDCVNSLVGFNDTDNLDTIIEIHSKRREFDFVSIDVDGLDYFIFQKMNKYLPKVICIEVNAGHSPEFSEIFPENIASNNIGQSLKVMTDLAKVKGYFPLCYTGNLFLVKNEYFDLFKNDVFHSIEDMYFAFLLNLDLEGIVHLNNTFIVNRVYNGVFFTNTILETFCKSLRT